LSEPAEAVRDLELQRLDHLQEAAWSKATDGDLRAIDTCLRVMERRSRMLGLDSPARKSIDIQFSSEELESEVQNLVKLLEDASSVAPQVAPLDEDANEEY